MAIKIGEHNHVRVNEKYVADLGRVSRQSERKNSEQKNADGFSGSKPKSLAGELSEQALLNQDMRIAWVNEHEHRAEAWWSQQLADSLPGLPQDFDINGPLDAETRSGLKEISETDHFMRENLFDGL